VKLGAFSVVDVDPTDLGGNPDRVRDVVALAEAAEGAGLASLWVAEHHFDGGGACPAPAVLLAACGARTERLRLGSLVSVLPFHRPVDVAEEYALLDRLIGGRLNLGVGSGYLEAEFAGFGVDPAEKRDRFESGLVTLRAAMSGQEFLAAPGAPRKVRLTVLPVQRPHPPLSIAVQRREALPYVAARGYGVALIPYATVANLQELRAQIDEYRHSLPAGNPGSVAAAVHLYAGAHPDAARTAFARYLESRRKTHSTFYAQKIARAPDAATPEALERADLALFGAPADVASRLRKYADAGVDELLGIFDFGGLAVDEVIGSVTTLGRAFHSR
jgi:alkanesulfonate monooxygenase SsuD/methylene tetrahydromethanopterin reductase-like flavin-dependent oxidoreductase (luciferase family)